MFKLGKILLLSIVLVNFALPSKSHAAAGLTKEHPILKFCDAATQIGMILSQYPMPHLWPSVQVLPFPPFIAPGLVVGFASRTAIVIELCNLLYDIEALGTQGAVYATGRYLNTLTDNKWAGHLDMADQTWNLANTLYDFEAGEQRKGALKSASAHREINDYMKTSYGWYNKTFNGSDAQLKNRGEREQEMNQFASLVNRRSILAEATSCPDPSGNPNYVKIYKKEIEPAEKLRDTANDDLIFFKTKLLEMGPRFVNDQKQLEEYISGIENMEVQGVGYKLTPGTKNEITKKVSPGRKDKTGKPVVTDVNIKKPIQTWTTTNFVELFENFKIKWGPQWQSFVKAQYLQSSQGLLTNAQERVEKDFQDLSYECNAARLMRGFDKERADYEKMQDERVEKCYKETPVNQKKAENILLYYVTQFQLSLKSLKDANATIWTKESFHLGTIRAVSGKPNTDGYQQEQVACADGNKMSVAEMQKLGLKQKEVTLEMKEIISKQHTKKASLQEMEAKANADATAEANKRAAFAEGQSKRNNENLKNNISPVPVQGGI